MLEGEEGEILSRPSSLPNDRRYEQVKKEVSSRFQRSNTPEDPGDQEFARREQELFEKARLDAKKDVIKLIPGLLDNYKTGLEKDISKRKTYGYAVFALVVIWLIVVSLLITLAGFGVVSLDSAVLVALTTGATISLVGILGTVVSYFFTKSNEQISLYRELFRTMIGEEGREKK